MLAPKPSPQVAFLDGKLYFFAGMRCCGMQAAPEPRFESYDPKKTDWEFLPNPPFYSYEAPSYLYVSVIGRRIFVTNPRGVSTYDVDDRTWTLSRDVEGTPFEFSGRVVAESDDGTVVGYTRRGVVAYSDDSLGRAQILEDLNSCLPIPHFNMQAAFLGYLGEHIYYLLLSEIYGRVTGGLDMHIVLFRLEMLPREKEARTHEVEGEGEADLCCVTVLRHHVYNAMKDITKEVFNPTHAFTMWSSADYAVLDAKPLSLSAKRNRKKKEKRLRQPYAQKHNVRNVSQPSTGNGTGSSQDWEFSVKDKDKKLKSQSVGKEKLQPSAQKHNVRNISQPSTGNGSSQKIGIVGDDRRPMAKNSPADNSSTVEQYDYLRKYGPISNLSSGSMTEESSVDANSEKELGNEYFKQNKFKEAIDCYSRSIALSPTAVAYANRAMAYLKIKSSMASSSKSSNSFNSLHFGNYEQTWTCHCGYPALIKTAWTRENPGRRFAGCRNYRVGPCKFFKWVEDDDLKTCKATLYEMYCKYKDLQSRNEELKQKFETKKKKTEELLRILMEEKGKSNGGEGKFKKIIVILVCIVAFLAWNMN